MTAAETEDPDDVAAATDQVRRFLDSCALLPRDYKPTKTRRRRK
ncbi:hypothetical protein ACLBXM_09320 [Xanthobacteraceae bacterium A53D]